MKNSHNSEDFLKTLATRYMQETGEEYRRELAALEKEKQPLPGLDGKMDRALRREKLRKRRIVWGAAAACLALLIVGVTPRLWQGDGLGHMTGAPAPAAPGASPDIATGAPAALEPFPNMVMEAPAAPEFLPDTRWAIEALPPTTEETADEPGRKPVSLTAPEGWRIVYADQDGDMTIFRLESAMGSTVAVSVAPSGAPSDYDGFRPMQIRDTQAHLLAASDHSALIYEKDNLQFTLTTSYDYRDLLSLAAYWLE